MRKADVQGHKVATLLTLMLGGSVAFAADISSTSLPTGGVVTSGTATINQYGANIDIHQSSQRAIINWTDFNIGSQAQVNIHQPDNTSAVLNRILSTTPSMINGQLNANGNVYLISPAGIVFGAGSTVNVSGMVASTMNLRDDDFLAGHHIFDRNGTTAGISNHGVITAASGGMIAMLAPELRNSGIISARLGTVVLAAGERITLDMQMGNGNTISVTVDPATIRTLIENRALVTAEDGRAIISAKAADKLLSSTINNSGIIEATSLTDVGGDIILDGAEHIINTGTLDASGKTGGSITVEASATGTATIGGEVNVTGHAGKGGKAMVTAERILIDENTHIDATGTHGGGGIYIGGGWQGSDPEIVSAMATVITPSAVLDASATDQGDGGTVVAWSDVLNAGSVTRAYGTFYAKAGNHGGDGGRIETSGHWLDTEGARGNASSLHGKAGLWLFDPYNVTITTASAQGSFNAANPDIWTPSGAASTVLASDITSRLESGTSVTITTTGAGASLGDITVSTAITKSSGNTDVTLILSAANTIKLDAAITNSGGTGKLNVNLNADNDSSGAGITLLNADISTGGGYIKFGTGATANINGVVTLVGGDVYVMGTGVQNLITAGGEVQVNGQMILANTSGLTISTSGGNVTFASLVDSGNSYTYVASVQTWTNALAAAASGAGGAMGSTYLATITSRLENSIASITANYVATWLGARRVVGVSTNAVWRWVAGPEGLEDTNGRQFYTENFAGAGGSAINSEYSNWGGGEPNNFGGANVNSESESALQFVGSSGQWNDLPKTVSTLAGYVREANLAPSTITVNAGAGTVTFSGKVGSNKQLAALNVTGNIIAINGTSVATTDSQTYTGSATLGAAATALTVSAGNFTSVANQTMTNATGAAATLSIQASGDVTLSSGSSISSSAGTLGVTLTSTGGDINLDSTSGISSNGGAILLVADTLTVAADATLQGSGTGTLTLKPYTPNSTIGVGTGAAGTVNYASGIFNSNLAISNFALVTIGASTTGLITLADTVSFANHTTIESGTSIILAASTALTAAKDLLLQADSGDITTANAAGTTTGISITKPSGTDATLTLKASGSIAIGGDNDNAHTISSSNNKLSVILNADSDASSAGAVLLDQVTLSTNGGNLTIGGGATPSTVNAFGVAGNVNGISAIHGVFLYETTIDAGAGAGAVSLRGQSAQASGDGLRVRGWIGDNNALTTTGTMTLTGSSASGVGVNLANQGGTSTYTGGNISIIATSLSFSSVENGGTPVANLQTGSGTITLNVSGGGSVLDTAVTTITAANLLLQGAGVTYTLNLGSHTLNTIAANTGTINLINTGSIAVGTVSAVDGITATGDVTIQASGANADITLGKAVTSTSGNIVLAAGRDFFNNMASDTGLIASGGGKRYMVYSSSPVSSTEAMTGYSKHYNQTYSAGSVPAYAGSGSWFLYSVVPTLIVTPSVSSITYGEADPAVTSTLTRFIDGDVTATSDISGAATFSIPSYTASHAGFRPAGSYVLDVDISTLASGLGYLFSTGGETATLIVSKKDVTLASMSATNKGYDGTTSATIVAYGALSNVISDDDAYVSVTVGTATFDTKNAGSGKTVTATGLTLTGSEAANYNLASSLTTTATITPATLTYVAATKKVYLGQGVTGLSGEVTGFMASDTQSTATSGTIVWSTTANMYNQPGDYPIIGSGLSAENYLFAQSASNNSALTVIQQPTIIPAIVPPITVPDVELPTIKKQLGNIKMPEIMRGNGVVISVVNTPGVAAGAPSILANVGDSTSFSFVVPKSSIEGITGSNSGKTMLSATLPNGSPLPSWLHFHSEDHSFTAVNVPAGGLPLTVRIVGNSANGQKNLEVTIAH